MSSIPVEWYGIYDAKVSINPSMVMFPQEKFTF